MWILWSKTQTTFIKNEKAIMQVYRLQRWIGDQEIEGWLKDTNEEQAKLSIWYTEKYGPWWIDPKPKFDHNYRLNLDLDQRFISITKFMNRINKFKMRDIFRISISEISMLCQNKVIKILLINEIKLYKLVIYRSMKIMKQSNSFFIENCMPYQLQVLFITDRTKFRLDILDIDWYKVRVKNYKTNLFIKYQRWLNFIFN